MKSKRLSAILSFLSIQDSIIDIGCDHAYIPIEMARLGATKILAVDIHQKALEIAKKNIKKEGWENRIETCLSDGLKNVDPSSYDTLILAGMGTTTIKHILNDSKKLINIQKIIVQSNNDLKELRTFFQSMEYRLEEEKIVLEKNHYYFILKYVPGHQELTEIELEFGLASKEKKEYYKFLKEKYIKLCKKVPDPSEYQRRIDVLEKNFL